MRAAVAEYANGFVVNGLVHGLWVPLFGVFFCVFCVACQVLDAVLSL